MLVKNNSAEEIAKALITMYFAEPKEENNVIDDEEVKLFLNLGRKDNIKAKDIVGSFIANTAISGDDIGKINVLDKYTFVQIPGRYVNELLDSMREKKIKGKNVNIEIANS